MTIQATKLVREFCKENNLQVGMVFNDKLVDGRSVKVYGWKKETYDSFAEWLNERGILGIVVTRIYHNPASMVIKNRIHIIDQSINLAWGL